jgi:hypothetical protein
MNKFKLPISYNKDAKKLSQHIIDDLELIKTADETVKPVYSHVFSKNGTKQDFVEQYTTDVQFLKDTQRLLKEYKPTNKPRENIDAIWKEIKTETGFKEKYCYIDWTSWEFLNKSEQFLQWMSVYNMTSPVISLCVPILLLIVPFIIIRARGLNAGDYGSILKNVLSNHTIGRLFTQFGGASTNEKMYMLVSAAFYTFSVYQNVLTCIRFNKNMTKIHTYLADVAAYLDYSINNMTYFLSLTDPMNSYSEFNAAMLEKMKTLIEFKHKLGKITEYSRTNYKKVAEIGFVMKCFYELYDDAGYNDAIEYSFGFHEYLDCLSGLQMNIVERNMNFAELTVAGKKRIMKKCFHASNDKPTRNSVPLHKNIAITGPNASGKTTLLKSLLINVILTQQFGCGFYESAQHVPYKHIYCYLNIPDTSGRDSLFQAEARRCKEIIDSVNADPKNDHFCVFDELYSGTNPEEATASATAFMEYLTKNENVTCLLTTHFTKVCLNLRKNNRLMNCHMSTEKIADKLVYTYKLKRGISNVKGCFDVLSGLNYPREILLSIR